MDILSLIKSDGYTFKKVANTSGGVFKGSCPWCGGNDRFSIYPNNRSGSYICNQCGSHGDTIEYLKTYRKLSYHEACTIVGTQPEIRHKKLSETINSSLEKQNNQNLQTKEIQDPEKLWSKKATGLVFGYFKYIFSAAGKNQREYLNARGLTNETIQKARIGVSPQSVNFDRSAFGLPSELNEKTGKQKNVWIPEGIAIPFFNPSGELSRLRIRQSKPLGNNKYIIIPGSSSQYFIYPDYSPEKPAAVVESEFDGWLIWQECRDLVNIFAIGNDSNKPCEYVDGLLKQSSKVLFCADFDQAGIKAFNHWKNNYSAILWLTPTGKDPSDAKIEGLNIREWIKAGIASNVGAEKKEQVIGIEPEETNQDYQPSLEMQPIEPEEAMPESQKSRQDKPAKPQARRNNCLDNEWCGRLKGYICLINNKDIFELEQCPALQPRWKKWIEFQGELGEFSQIIKMPQLKKRQRRQ